MATGGTVADGCRISFLVPKAITTWQENWLPTPVPFETMPPYRLTMPSQVAGFCLRDFGELQISQARYVYSTGARAIPCARSVSGVGDAREADKTQLARIESIEGPGRGP